MYGSNDKWRNSGNAFDAALCREMLHANSRRHLLHATRLLSNQTRISHALFSNMNRENGCDIVFLQRVLMHL
jgi:hypothetical protein